MKTNHFAANLFLIGKICSRPMNQRAGRRFLSTKASLSEAAVLSFGASSAVASSASGAEAAKVLVRAVKERDFFATVPWECPAAKLERLFLSAILLHAQGV